MAEELKNLDADVIVIGAGISGLATAKCARDVGFNVIVIERTDAVGGLWVFREDSYGVMKFTHINVSKHNYCFSEYPFPDDVPDFPHNKQMAEYIENYTKHFNITDHIRFETEVTNLEKNGDIWQVNTRKTKSNEPEENVLRCKFVAIATGHHAKPTWPDFDGQKAFNGKILHSVDFNDAISNGLEGKRVLIVGIGNSAVDAAVNCITEGRCPEVHLSTRSGAWVLPNYIFGCPVDHYSCRLLLWLPWRILSSILEVIIATVHGHPKKWNLNPKMKAMQTQPTVSPTLIHHIQRGSLKIHPNIKKMEDHTVYFEDNTQVEVDAVIFCTGYAIDLPYLHEDLRKKVVLNGNQLRLYKNVFHPDVGHSLAFIGFVQPASGGVISMSEIQGRWWAELCRGNITLPSREDMLNENKREMDEGIKRYYKSARHTIQRDPIIYCDDIAQKFGAKPEISWKKPILAWRLLIGTCGPAQYRLQGPGTWNKAHATISSVPLTGFLAFGPIVLIVILAIFLFFWLF